ncbi:hypothetical protein SEA_CLARK_24 [Gordonia phage Clark]|uniref:Uncharacterized protein n=6 Tax=Beenievirus TaxID=3044673 RepID=A0A5P8DAX0_9CAUD|nr:hypothetical protein PP504_gp24 [Gordonia phage Dolores]YP_010654345.1 hypothetical protein PP506_gp23 [Gordonia phage DobbysSock]YP_010654419.1 hypothetical protein PP507_gp24 [Gordonia phage Clark]YP_010654497.1 membrane protein [Gordonia phage Samman98]YP_010654576.1 membrane protein [Gordonia phage MichaelScott]URM87925.1 hypothetical protein SEA_WINKNICK_24 [Gordonia phage WinkNick]UTN93537.1 membrane protein [Gordonia phage Oregano]QDF17973.1 hypothetical protein SEA_CLARK_24 [Gordo
MTMWNYVIVGAGGFLTGLMVELGYLKVKGRRILLPFISPTARNFTIAAILLAVISLTTVYNVDQTGREAAECDRQFREALRYNTNLTAQQRQLDEHEDALDGKTRENLNRALRNVAAAAGHREDVLAAITNYNEVAAAIDAEFDQLYVEREQINAERKPYPEPTCGPS